MIQPHFSQARPHSTHVAHEDAAPRRRLLAHLLALATTSLLTGALGASRVCASEEPASDGFFFHDRDTPIEFIGDSITEQRMYTTLIESFVLSRYPQWQVTFRNVGWSGDTAWFQMRGGLENALSRDLLPQLPRAATIDFGMNDARGGLNSLGLYRSNLEALVTRLQQTGCRVAVCSPSPEERYEADQQGGSAYNQMLGIYAEAAKAIAAAHHAVYVDQLTPFIGVITRGRTSGILGASGEPRLMYDGVHPNWGGHLVMAASILSGLSAPSLVSSMTIDARSAAAAITAQAACHGEILPGPLDDDEVLRFARLDERLPWPLPSEAALVQRIPGFTPLADLSRYDLTVTGLTPGSYQLSIDHEVVGTFSAQALASGVNLTSQCGPILSQMHQLFAAIVQKNNTYYERWRTVQLYAPPAWLSGVTIDEQRSRELARLDQSISDQERAITALRQPHAHLWELRNAPPASPHGLTVSHVGTALTLQWALPEAPAPADATMGASAITGYLIERALPGKPFTTLSQVPATVSTYRDGDAAADSANTSASYRLIALAGVHRSASSLACRADAPASGWGTSFFADTHLGTTTLARFDPVIDFTWSSEPPAPGLSRVNFSARWCGVITVPASGRYSLIATADDGVRVALDGVLVIDQWRDQAPTECTGAVELQAGSRHDLVVSYYQGGGDAVMKLEWRTPAGVRQLLPASAVAPALWQP
jgi:lysophospholipase L1-like esterase